MISRTLSSGGFRPRFLQTILIGVGSFWAFSPSFHGDWLWDDNVYIVANPLMDDPAGLWKIWFQPGILIDYYPITFSVERLEWNLWGMESSGYHLVSFVLHLASALLVWQLFSKFGLRLAWLGGLLFALHPVQVESVAWVSELKNTLCLPPFLLAMCAWLDYDHLGKQKDYFWALGLFLVALLCKITVIMFPVVILLYAWWKRGRIGRLDLKISAPFFAVSLAIGLIPILTGVWNRDFNNLGPEFMPTGGNLGRFVLAGQEIAFYFSKSVLPVGLLPVYPKWPVDVSSPAQYLPWVVLIGVAGWLWTKRQGWGRHALLGLGFFLINLLPCPGFIPSPNMGYAWVMDHFLYLPIIGLIGLAVAGLGVLSETRSNFAQACTVTIAALIVTFFAVSSHAYSKLYENSRSLWTYAFQHNPASWMVRSNMGEVLMQSGLFPEAVDQFETVVKIIPLYPNGHFDLARALARAGRPADAIQEYEMALKLNPGLADAAYELGSLLIQANRIPEATEQLGKALEASPQNAAAHYALGNLLIEANKIPEAIAQYDESLQINPNDPEAHSALGKALLKINRLPEALDQCMQATQLNPNDADSLSNAGVALARMGRFPEAMEQFKAALQIHPDDPDARNNLGSLFLVTGRFPEAIEQYQAVLRIKPDFVPAQKNLSRAQEMEKAHGTTTAP